MKVHYVPAGCESYVGKNKINPEELIPEYLLMNATEIKNEKILNYAIERKKYINSKGKLVFIDSGGFQLATGTSKNLDARKVIEIQNKIGNIGFILDVPPFEKSSESTGAASLVLNLSNNFFKKCLEQTRKNIISAREVKKEIEYYFINQGATFEQLSLWYNELSHLDKFDGIATKSATIGQLLLGLMFVESKTDFKKHHILGVGSTLYLMLINYFWKKSKKNMERITYDNTVALINSSKKMVIIPFFSKKISLGKYEKFCDIEGISFEKLKKDYFEFFKLDVNILNKQQEIMDSLVENEENFKEFVDSKNKVYFEIIDYYYQNNLEKTIEKYKNLLNSRISNHKQISLFKF